MHTLNQDGSSTDKGLRETKLLGSWFRFIGFRQLIYGMYFMNLLIGWKWRVFLAWFISKKLKYFYFKFPKLPRSIYYDITLGKEN